MKSKLSKIGIVGGSGVDKLIFSQGFDTKEINTKYGNVSVEQGKLEGKDVFFLNRHTKGYLSPSHINYRANLAALHNKGAEAIIATAAVGAISKKFKPGDFVLLTDFIDFTKARGEGFTPGSFIDLSEPYDPDLRHNILKAAKQLKIKVNSQATYVCTEGSRFETKAEIKMFAKLGADVVGMTQIPEVVLAAEAGIPYAVIAIVTNYAAGIYKEKISSKEVFDMMKDKATTLSSLLLQTIKNC
ncbi:MAG: MTAP family purine nucleoside phosphorylase [Candidatus Margulisbacteria bacterium]|nr:MTAP family purine nucleoside phosphorylase [Candidatus Margulisiibacteriota bacterium]